jgi:hypothetical protein
LTEFFLDRVNLAQKLCATLVEELHELHMGD